MNEYSNIYLTVNEYSNIYLTLNGYSSIYLNVDSIIKNLSTKKTPGLGSLIGKFPQTFKEEIAPILDRLFQIIDKEGTLHNSFYETSINLITNLKRTLQEMKITDQSLSHECRHKSCKQNISEQKLFVFQKSLNCTLKSVNYCV